MSQGASEICTPVATGAVKDGRPEWRCTQCGFRFYGENVRPGRCLIHPRTEGPNEARPAKFSELPCPHRLERLDPIECMSCGGKVLWPAAGCRLHVVCVPAPMPSPQTVNGPLGEPIKPKPCNACKDRPRKNSLPKAED